MKSDIERIYEELQGIKKNCEDISKLIYMMDKVLIELVILQYPNDKYYLLNLISEYGLEKEND